MKRTTLDWIVLIALALSTPALAQVEALPRAEPATAGMIGERLRQFDTLAAEYVADRKVAGVVALVLRDGAIVHETVTGLADVDSGAPLQEDAIFRIASQTKLVASVATMMLVESGRLRLEAPVADYLPAYAQTTVAVAAEDGGEGEAEIVPAARPITVRDLLTHTAGIPGNRPNLFRDRYDAAMRTQGLLQTLDEPVGDMVDRLASLPFAAQPGEKWVYGLGTDVLGAVIEVASGMPLDRFFETRIFAPLAMSDTSFYLPPEKADRLAAIHVRDDSGALRRGSDDDPGWEGQGAFVDGPRRMFLAGSGLLSTAQDYARFLQMLLNGGELDGARILSPTSVRLMTVDHVGAPYAADFPGMGFGFNVEVKVDPARSGYDVPAAASVGAFGWGGAAYTRFWVDPEQRLVGVFMTQTRPTSGDLHARFMNIVYGAIATP